MKRIDKPSFRIGVPTYKRPYDLEKFLAAIADQIRGKQHISLVVVNDASHDEDYAKVISKYEDIVDYRIQEINKGCGPSRVAALENATEDYLVCTDDDCVPTEYWVEWMEALVLTNPDVDLFAGEIEPVWYKEPGLVDQLLAIPESYPGPVMTECGLLTAIGANSIFRRSLYEKAGGIPVEIQGAAEDCCVTQRVIKSGGTYHLAYSWVNGHKAKNTIGELRGRFYGYGLGGAQYVLLEQDWVFAEMSSDASYRQAWEGIKMRVQREWARGREEYQHPLKRFSFAIMTGLIALEYERGWKAGLKKYSKMYPLGVPKQPSYADQFVNFANDLQKNTAMGSIEN